MIRIIVIFFISFSCNQLYAQDNLIDCLVSVRKLLSDTILLNPQEAMSQLQQIENKYILSENDTTEAVYYSLKGQALFLRESYKECIPYFNKAIQLFEKTNLRQYEYLDAFRFIAFAYHRTLDYDNAERYYRKGLLRSVAANVNNVSQYNADMYLNLGYIYKEKGDSVLANDCFLRAKEQHNKINDIEDWNYIDWENQYWKKINELKQAEKYQDAVDLYSEMINGIIEKRGKDSRYILPAYSKAILLSRYLNKYEEALPIFEDVINCAKNISLLDESVCGSYCNLALCYSYLGNYEQLDVFISKAKEILSLANNSYYPPHSIYRFAGNGAYWTQNYEKAIKYYEQYLSPDNKVEPGNSYDEITNMLGVAYIFDNKPEKAKKLLIDFLKLNEERIKKSNHQVLANIYHNLGRAYMLEGNKNIALKYLQKSEILQKELYNKTSERTQQYIEECKKR